MTITDYISWLSEQIDELTDKLNAERVYGPKHRAMTKERASLIAERKMLMRAPIGWARYAPEQIAAE